MTLKNLLITEKLYIILLLLYSGFVKIWSLLYEHVKDVDNIEFLICRWLGIEIVL